MNRWAVALLVLLASSACGGASGRTPRTALGTTGQGAVLDISKAWKFRAGDDPEWSRPEHDDSEWADVELGKPGEGLGGADYDGYAWYRAKLTVPARFQDSADFQQCRRLLLSLGWINAVDQTWFNGKTVGQTGSFDAPRGKRPRAQKRVYEIPEELVRWRGDNVVAVRVYDPEGKGATWRETATLSVASWRELFAVNVDTRTDDGVFPAGEWMQVYAVVNNRTSATIKGQLVWRIETDEQLPLKETPLPLTVEPGVIRQRYCPLYELPAAGFYRVVCTFRADGADGTVSDAMTVGYAPDRIDQAVTREADFTAFWDSALSELRQVDPQYKVLLQEDKSDAERDLYLVEMQSLGGLTIRGWYEAPRGEGKHPALLMLPGYEGRMRPVNRFDDMVILSLNIRSHGNSDEAPGGPADLWLRGLDRKEEYYYRGAYMDCIRAVDFLASRPEVDPERIAVWGGSQGGGLSFATAALDKRISLCMADVPWLCDWVKFFKTSHWDEIDDWLAADPGRSWTTMLRTLSYFDAMNMADRIECPVFMAVGLQDTACPPSTCFATFNKIRSQKEYRVYPDAGHRLGRQHWEFGYEWLRERLGLGPGRVPNSPN